MILLHPSLRTSAADGKLTSILKANTVANENAWPLFEGWVGIDNGGESRAQERPVSLRWVVHCWPTYFQVIFWKIYKVWQFRHMAGLLLSSDGWRTNPLYPICPASSWPPGLCQRKSAKQILCFSLCPQCRVLRPQMCSASCWKSVSFPRYHMGLRWWNGRKNSGCWNCVLSALCLRHIKSALGIDYSCFLVTE